MTTLTIQVDDALLEKTRSIAEARDVSVDAVIADALARMDVSSDPAAGFLSLVDELAAKDFRMPILSREERNARQ